MKNNHFFLFFLALSLSKFILSCDSKTAADQKGQTSRANSGSTQKSPHSDDERANENVDDKTQDRIKKKQQTSDSDESHEEQISQNDPSPLMLPAIGGSPAPQPPAPSTPTPSPPANPPTNPQPPPAFTLTSSAFANNAAIPVLYVAKNNGGNQSPPLAWANPPANTASFAIQCVDLDTNPPILHWMISNIPATSKLVPANILAGNSLTAPPEALGANQIRAYRGPNPPNLHRYEFTIYAIKTGETLNLTANSATNKTELEAKSITRATLIGTFQ
jgi:Raf kinase inhibitor-like YbhB/YbcL family protein